MKWVLLVAGLVGAMVLAVVLVKAWLNWRRRMLTEAGARIGLTALRAGEKLMVPLVPLIDRPGREYLVLLAGTINGYDGGFFELYVGSGNQWTLQSTVLLRDSSVQMPKFQLRTPKWWEMYQRTRGVPVDLPGREHEMRGLRLTSDDPDWARGTFSRASSEFLEKARRGRWTIEGMGRALVVYQWGLRVSDRGFERYVQRASELGAEMFSLCGPEGGLSDQGAPEAGPA